MERDLDIELRFHLERQIEANLAAGMAPGEARRAALLSIGGIEQIKEECRDARGLAFLESLAGDLRYALRTLRRTPSFTAAAILCLALGVGANSAVFTIINAVLVRPLPFAEPDRLALVYEHSKTFLPRSEACLLTYRGWHDHSRRIERLAAFHPSRFLFTGGGDPEYVNTGLVSADFFPLLGEQPWRGHFFTAEEDQPGNNRFVILGHAFWRLRFGADEGVIGRQMIFNNEPFVVLGILRPGFRFLPAGDAAVWAPVSLEQSPPSQATGRFYLHTLGRLKPGVTLADAQAELSAIAREVTGGRSVAEIGALRDEMVGMTRRPLLLLLGAVALVLLIAIANVANLQLAHAAGRTSEMAIRTTLGAGRARVARQLIIESLALALLGGGAGLLVAPWTARLVSRLPGADLPRVHEFAVDWRVLGFTLAASVAAGVLFGLAPVLQASRTEISVALKDAGRQRTSSSRSRRLRHLLIAVEAGVALVLVAGAGLMLNSLWRVLHTDPGFRIENLLTMELRVPVQHRGPQDIPRIQSQLRAIYGALLPRLRSLAGIGSAALASELPLGGFPDFQGFVIEGQANPPGRGQELQYRVVTPDYFRTMGIPLLRGRLFTDRDDENAPAVAVVSETMERRYFGGNALGRRVRSGDFPAVEIVGVVGDVRHRTATAQPLAERYAPLAQAPRSWLSLAIRTTAEPATLAAAVRGEIRGVDRNIVVSDIQTMQQRRAAALGISTLLLWLLTGFAGLAVLLACAGGYGVVSYSVAQRTHEIGVRMALGASRGGVIGMILRETAVVVIAGAAAGLVAAAWLTRLLAKFLFGVAPTDPLTLIGAGLLIVAVALGAAWVPARRAARVMPSAALRFE